MNHMQKLEADLRSLATQIVASAFASAFAEVSAEPITEPNAVKRCAIKRPDRVSSVNRRVIAALPAPTDVIAKAIGEPKWKAGKRLNNMKRYGFVRRNQRGIWEAMR